MLGNQLITETPHASECRCISHGPLIQLKGDPHLCRSSSHDYFTTKVCSSSVLWTRIFNSNYLHERRILNILTLNLQIELSSKN